MLEKDQERSAENSGERLTHGTSSVQSSEKTTPNRFLITDGSVRKKACDIHHLS